jgi:hypothetical protein
MFAKNALPAVPVPEAGYPCSAQICQPWLRLLPQAEHIDLRQVTAYERRVAKLIANVAFAGRREGCRRFSEIFPGQRRPKLDEVWELVNWTMVSLPSGHRGDLYQ